MILSVATEMWGMNKLLLPLELLIRWECVSPILPEGLLFSAGQYSAQRIVLVFPLTELLDLVRLGVFCAIEEQG